MRTSDGDGTVPIISTGLMCYKGWRTKRLNPSNIPIVSREYVHQPTSAFKDLRYSLLSMCVHVTLAPLPSAVCDTTPKQNAATIL